MTNILTPVGRFVQGSLYTPQTSDAEGKPLSYKSGPNAGQPRSDYYFAIAIAKGVETHWKETPWGMIVYSVAQQGFPGGQTNLPNFAWKIVDGDSSVPNKVGKKPCDREGYPGHWVLNFSSGYAPTIVNEDGSKTLHEENFVKLGDYIQVFGTVVDNKSALQPGVFLNHSHVAFSRYGQRISLGINTKSIGFGNSPIPAGASLIPLDTGFNPGATSDPVIPPYPEILNIPTVPVVPVPPPVPKTRVMTELAGGSTYEQMIASGWTDTLLIQHGMMKP